VEYIARGLLQSHILLIYPRAMFATAAGSSCYNITLILFGLRDQTNYYLSDQMMMMMMNE